MQAFNFKNLTGALNNSLHSVDVSGLTKNFKSTVQSTRERLGQVDPSEVTELPEEYKALENRVDALYNVHKGMLKIAKVHETESYDYPTQITESFGELTHQVSTGWTNFAHNNLKNANLPFPIAPAHPAKEQPVPPKTLPHAMSRAARQGALHIGTEEKLGKALETYATAMEKVGDARLQQDEIIVDQFITPWQATLSSSIALANKARANVKTARLELDTARAELKTASAKTQEQARLQVEEAEDKLVQMTETAIGLMKAVLENPEPLQNLSSLVKAQLIFFSTAAETLSNIQGEIEEAAVAAETEYRQTRAA
ncbi:BAR domain-containing protein [Naganishia albida]|nr:BAR domain-containing protein [Naganishia albida]